MTAVMALAAFRLAIAFGCWGGLLFWAAGTLHWTRAWIHLGLWLATFLVNLAVLLYANPAVLMARLKRQRASRKPDFILLTILLPVTLAVPVVAGLDAVRWMWSAMPSWLMYLGIALHCVGDGLALWAMAVNPYLEKTVRIQTERDHRVITTGPYALVRHPMYFGLVFMLVGISLVLGSLWSFVPVGVMVILMIIRTVFEDRTLQLELPGYREYTQKTRYRIFPGIW